MLRALGNRPVLLLLTILAFNAAARPYRHFVHDARLYGFQVLNRVHDGAFDDDLFFRYGSQDQFSIFSTLVEPLVHVVGIDTAFFALFFVCNILLLWSFQRLVCVLIEDRVLSTLALLLLAISPLPYGGFNIFTIQESFLTPRLLANALVLFGLERAYRRQWTSAFLFQIVACLVHPLMAIAGLFIVAVWWIGEMIGWKKTLIAGGCCAATGVVVLAIPSLAVRLFGYMDPEWRTLVLLATPYNFPSEWHLADWVNVGFSFAILIAALAFLYRDDATKAKFLTVVCGFGIAGLLGTVIASHLPYAVLFQGQPYRAVWIVKFLEIPLAMWLVARLWKIEVNFGYAALTGFLVYFGMIAGFTPDVWLIVLFVAISVFVYRAAGLSKNAHWLWRSVLIGLVVSMAAWSIYLTVLMFLFQDQMPDAMSDVGFIWLIGKVIGPLFWLAFGVMCLSFLKRNIGLGRAYGSIMAAVLIVVQVSFFVLYTLPAAQQWYSPRYDDVQFVQNFLQRQQTDRPPMIYSCLGNSKYLWIDWQVVSYFDRNQVSGVLFNRATAVEGSRRAKVVRRFEIDRLRSKEDRVSDEKVESVLALYEADFSCPKPTVDDLVRLVKENVDYIVLKQEFPGLYSATNGRVFIYERRSVLAKAIPARGLALASASR